MPYARVKNELPLIPGYAFNDSFLSFSDALPGAPINKIDIGILNQAGIKGTTIGCTGKNLTDLSDLNKPSWYTGGWSGTTLNSNNGINQTRSYINGGCGGFVVNLPAGTYTVSYDVVDPNIQFTCGVWACYDGTTLIEILPASTFMSTDGSRKYISFTITDPAEVAIRSTIEAFATGQTSVDLNNIQIEKGSFNTVFESFTGNIYKLDWSSEVGSVAMGSVHIDKTGTVNVTSGGVNTPIASTAPIKTHSGVNNVFVSFGHIQLITYIRRLDS